MLKDFILTKLYNFILTKLYNFILTKLYNFILTKLYNFILTKLCNMHAQKMVRQKAMNDLHPTLGGDSSVARRLAALLLTLAGLCIIFLPKNDFL